jgi:hypothetical protein
LGLNLKSMLRSNSEGSGGGGNGEARNTAASIDCRTESSPLQARTSALSTVPPGACVTKTRQSSPATADAGRIHARWTRA